jgi:tetratricopeptide (TPR) repeat protein
VVNRQQGRLDEAILNLRSVLEDRTPDMQTRGFDFSLDFEVINLLGQTLFDQGRLRARQGRDEEARQLWQEAIAAFTRTLAIDSEDVTAHHNLQLLYAELGEEAKSKEHESLHRRYKPDDNAQGRAVRLAREKYPAANHAAEAVVKYSLQRTGAPGFPVVDADAPRAVRGSPDPAPTVTEGLQEQRGGQPIGEVGRPAPSAAPNNKDTVGGGL